MATYGSVGKKQALADLPVREPFPGELCNLELLSGEAIAGVGCSLANFLTRRAELLPCPFAPLAGAEDVEHFDALSQWRPCISRTALSPQPAAEREQRPRL